MTYTDFNILFIWAKCNEVFILNVKKQKKVKVKCMYTQRTHNTVWVNQNFFECILRSTIYTATYISVYMCECICSAKIHVLSVYIVIYIHMYKDKQTKSGCSLIS